MGADAPMASACVPAGTAGCTVRLVSGQIQPAQNHYPTHTALRHPAHAPSPTPLPNTQPVQNTPPVYKVQHYPPKSTGQQAQPYAILLKHNTIHPTPLPSMCSPVLCHLYAEPKTITKPTQLNSVPQHTEPNLSNTPHNTVLNGTPEQ